jgi:Zn-dependent protease
MLEQDMVEARSINPGFQKPSFSKIEIQHITISIIVLAIAFAMIYARSSRIVFDTSGVMNFLYWFGISIVLVVCSFLLHEFGHKFVAQKYGAWAEFRMWPAGLGLALVSGFLGFLFAAPGAVYIDGRIDEKVNGKISIAGPAVNFAIAAIALLVWYLTLNQGNWFMSFILCMLVNLNAFLGLFNLIPFPPFDGSKVIKWSLPLWICMLAIGVVLFLASRNMYISF